MLITTEVELLGYPHPGECDVDNKRPDTDLVIRARCPSCGRWIEEGLGYSAGNLPNYARINEPIRVRVGCFVPGDPDDHDCPGGWEGEDDEGYRGDFVAEVMLLWTAAVRINERWVPMMPRACGETNADDAIAMQRSGNIRAALRDVRQALDRAEEVAK